MNAPAPQGKSARNKRVSAVVTVGVAGLMLGLSFAAVPLYRMFCAVTGYGGTTQRVPGPRGCPPWG